jgi:hypothetical protein
MTSREVEHPPRLGKIGGVARRLAHAELEVERLAIGEVVRVVELDPAEEAVGARLEYTL